MAPEVLPKFLLPANVSITLGVVALAWSKTSFAVTLICVLSGWERRILYLAIITLNATHAISAMLPWISCRPLQYVATFSSFFVLTLLIPMGVVPSS